MSTGRKLEPIQPDPRPRTRPIIDAEYEEDPYAARPSISSRYSSKAWPVLGAVGGLACLGFVFLLGSPSNSSGAAPHENVVATTSADDQAPSASSPCQRPEIQELVGKEFSGRIVREYGRSFIGSLGLVGLKTGMTPDDMAKTMENAQVTLDHVSELGIDESGHSYGCQGNLRLDASTATTGQDVLTIEGLVWSIDFGRAIRADEAQTDQGYTVGIPPQSLGRGIRVNGKPVDAEPPAQADQAAAMPTDQAGQASAQAGENKPAAATQDNADTGTGANANVNANVSAGQPGTGDVSGKQKPYVQ